MLAFLNFVVTPFDVIADVADEAEAAFADGIKITSVRPVGCFSPIMLYITTFKTRWCIL